MPALRGGRSGDAGKGYELCGHGRAIGAAGNVHSMLALLFPGQGSQRPGMGLPWRDHPSFEVARRVGQVTGKGVERLLLDADAATLRQTRYAQPAMFALSLVVLDAARHVLGRAGEVVAVAGHSLGEYSALVAAGALEEQDAARLVAERAEAMQDAADLEPGTMAAILGADTDVVAKACAGVAGAWVANDNAPGQIVVAGTEAGVAEACDAAKALGAKRVIPLPVGGAFHSPLMGPAQARLDAALSAARFTPSRLDVVANVDATAHRDGWREHLSAQLARPVRWRESLLAMAALGADTFVELGPGAELSGMVKRTVPEAKRVSIASPDDFAGFPA